MAGGWLNAFNATWYGRVSADPGSAADPMGLAGQVIGSAGPAYFDGLGLPAQQQGIFDGVLQFGMGNWQDKDSLRDRIVGLTMQLQGLTSEEDRARLTAIYNLGRNPSDSLILEILTAGMPDKSTAESIFYLGRNPSDGAIGNYLIDQAITGLKNSDEGRNMSISDLQNATDLIHDAWGLGPSATKQDFDNYVLNKVKKGLNETERQAVDEIWGWGPNPNGSIIRSYVLGEAGKGLNESENRTLAELYDLGRNASNESLKGFVVSRALDEMNLTSNSTYFITLLNLDRNLSDGQLKSFARDWEAAHGYDDPKILPDSVVNNLAAGDVVLYMASVSDLEESQASQRAVKAIRGHVAETLKQYPGVEAYVTGSTAMSVDTEWSAMDDVNNIDKVTVILVLVLLALYFRSFLTPFVPLVIIGVAVAASFGFMGLISTQIDVFYLVMTFMVVIMLGAGTDYCVFMLSRYAEERSKGAEVKDAVRAAVTNAGKSIASSGSTAMIGFGSLMLIDQGIFRSIGIGTAASVLFSMLVALMLVPAVLTVAGDRLFWPRKLYKSGPGMTADIWRGITSWVLKHSKVIIVLALLVTVPAIYIFTQLQLGDDFVSMMPNTVESKMGYDLLNDQFGSGALEKGMVIATLPSDVRGLDGNYSPEALDRIEALSASLAATPGVDKVYSLTRPEGAIINYANLSSYKGAEKEYYQSYMDNNTGQDNRTTLLYLSFVGSPFSEGAHQTIDRIRDKMREFESASPGTALLLGGGAVGTYEYEKLCTDKYALVIPAVLLGIFIVLVLLLRSIFTPARLIMTLLMSATWTLAAFILVFQDWLQASVYWILPIILFCVLMGLGVDYDIFLVSRIREEVFKGKTEEDAIIHAVESTGTIITLCGAVMASAFGSMMISSTMMLKEFGFVLCLAIILDATLVRLVIVPSIMVLMKKYNWWMPFVKEQAPLITAPEIQKPR
jgi:RND superfamily putative drug exporter